MAHRVVAGAPAHHELPEDADAPRFGDPPLVAPADDSGQSAPRLRVDVQRSSSRLVALTERQEAVAHAPLHVEAEVWVEVVVDERSYHGDRRRIEVQLTDGSTEGSSLRRCVRRA